MFSFLHWVTLGLLLCSLPSLSLLLSQKWELCCCSGGLFCRVPPLLENSRKNRNTWMLRFVLGSVPCASLETNMPASRGPGRADIGHFVVLGTSGNLGHECRAVSSVARFRWEHFKVAIWRRPLMCNFAYSIIIAPWVQMEVISSASWKR